MEVVHWNFNKIKQLFCYVTTSPSSQNKNQMGQSLSLIGYLRLSSFAPVNPRFPYCLSCQPSGNVVAAGLGDGNVVVLDIEVTPTTQPQPSPPPSSPHTSPS